jgi:nitrate/nitrite transporter NarK
MLRSIASVVVSYLVVFALVSLSDPVIAHFFPGQYVRGKVPPDSLLWLSTGVFALASVLGGWLCVRLASSHYAAHLLWLFLLGEAVGGVFTVANWKTWPHWQSFVWLVVWPVCLWLGGLGRRAQVPPAASAGV